MRGVNWENVKKLIIYLKEKKDDELEELDEILDEWLVDENNDEGDE